MQKYVILGLGVLASTEQGGMIVGILQGKYLSFQVPLSNAVHQSIIDDMMIALAVVHQMCQAQVDMMFELAYRLSKEVSDCSWINGVPH